MTNKDTESKIRQAFTNAVPDLRDSILSDCKTQKGAVIIMTDTNKKTLWTRRLAGIAAAFVLLIGGMAGFGVYRANYSVASTVSLDVNPSIEIQVNKKEQVLTVIPRNEDAKIVVGDMDFKVAGTEKGITALQMDIKIEGLSRQILEESLTQAKIGRMHILDHMMSTISTPREELSQYAPKIIMIRINPDKIRDVIGPGGKVINKIIEETSVKIDTEQDGTIYISSPNSDMNEKAKAMIENIVREAKVGEYYLGKVKRIEKFGAFLEIFPGKDGLLHISEIQEERTKAVEDVLKMGDELLVKVIEIDNQGRVNLSRKVVLKEEKEAAEKGKNE